MLSPLSIRPCLNARARARVRRAAAIAAAVICIDTVGAEAVLYDAALGKHPDEAPWSWTYAPYGVGTIARFFEAGAFVFDTSAFSLPGYAGYGRNAGAVLDSGAGFSLDFAVRIGAESHANANRSGVSLIVTDHSAKGIELSFWTDEIFAKNADDGFTHGESIYLDTRTPRAYRLTFQSGQYTLVTPGADVLTGALRDYALVADPPFNVIPYGTPNYVFFGDNTSSASGRVDVSGITLAPVPEPAQWILLLAGVACVGGVAGRTRRRGGVSLISGAR